MPNLKPINNSEKNEKIAGVHGVSPVGGKIENYGEKDFWKR